VTALSLYLSSASPLHRLPPRVKLAALVLAEAGVLVAVRSPLAALAAAAATVTLFALARVPVGIAWRQLRTILALATVVGLAQSFPLGAQQATVLAAQILLCVALAALVTLTTRTTELLDAVEGWCAPLRHIGVEPARVALVLALAIRSVPVVASLAGEVREAHHARGARLSATGLAVPLILRTLRHAEQLGEALVARGVDD
jgi:biotin transport system permease protein